MNRIFILLTVAAFISCGKNTTSTKQSDGFDAALMGSLDNIIQRGGWHSFDTIYVGDRAFTYFSENHHYTFIEINKP